jgi:hypothetical protein
MTPLPKSKPPFGYPLPRPLKQHRWYPWETDMTVCIAAVSIADSDPLIVVCMDLKGSTEYTSAETTSKWRVLRHDFYALLSGPISPARELASACHIALGEQQPASIAQVLKRLRRGVGLYKKRFADEYTYRHFAMSYETFVKTGGARFADVFYQCMTEIKQLYQPAELIVAGFLGNAPVLFKISGGEVWSCDDVAVIGSGTLLGEAALSNREQHMLYGLNRTLYNVFEAKTLAQRAEGVGERTNMFIVRPEEHVTQVMPGGIALLREYFQIFGPQAVQVVDCPESAFQHVVRRSVSVKQSDDIGN